MDPCPNEELPPVFLACPGLEECLACNAALLQLPGLQVLPLHPVRKTQDSLWSSCSRRHSFKPVIAP